LKTNVYKEGKSLVLRNNKAFVTETTF